MKSGGYEWNEGLCTTAMTSVISSLPKSITALTGDNPSEPPSENTLDPNDHHPLCHLLLFQELAPSLRHVYIRLGSICPWMFKMNGAAKHSHLETLVINISLDEKYVPLAPSLCSWNYYFLRPSKPIYEPSVSENAHLNPFTIMNICSIQSKDNSWIDPDLLFSDVVISSSLFLLVRLQAPFTSRSEMVYSLRTWCIFRFFDVGTLRK